MFATSSPSSRPTPAPMPWRSRFAKPLSTNAAALLVGATGAAAVAGAIGLVAGVGSLAAVGLIAAIAFAGAFAVFLIVSERRRHESAEEALQAQAAFLESLVDSLAALASSHEAAEILDRTCKEARELFNARAVQFVEESSGGEARIVQGGVVVPRAVRGEP